MRSSYNLIKVNSTLNSDKKKIETNYISKVNEVVIDNVKNSVQYEIKQSYENLGEGIIKRAREEAERIIRLAKEKSLQLEKEAYEKGYNQGKSNGYEDGYNYGLEKVYKDTEEEVKNNILKAEEILKKSNIIYKEYLKEKEKDILNISIEIGSIIARKELEKDNGLLPLIEEVLNDSKEEENIIIKCNTKHVKAIEEKVDYYKKAYSIKDSIFVLEDILMEEGNAIIEKSSGKAIVGLDIGLKNIEKALSK